ncbi:Golgi-associated plant pathogenesis-related protein 1-like isoform X2 [Phyllopteryx taeniolatus]|nr:Golgi-associated plant pathogenesis-related protein 1-like isoform X2 [Phyllopteryx taeniolatus]
MTLNNELNAAAQEWAHRLLTLGAAQHSDSNDGENIYFKWSSVPIKLTGKEAVDSWYGEVQQYNWRNPGFQSNTGHFTQVVWKASTQLGVGMATDGNKVFVVGQYRPAGNISMSQNFRENVLPRAISTPSPAYLFPISTHHCLPDPAIQRQILLPCPPPHCPLQPRCQAIPPARASASFNFPVPMDQHRPSDSLSAEQYLINHSHQLSPPPPAFR